MPLNLMIQEVKCPVCGKVFIPSPEHVYKVYLKGYNAYKKVCSYHCMMDYRRKKKGRNKN